MKPKPIKIFLASSIKEFEHERFALKDFKRRLNDVLVELDDYDVFVKLFICECADDYISEDEKQKEYDREIDETDIFIIMIGKKCGKYTLREYEYALDIKREKPQMKIIAAFKNLQDDAIDEAAVDFKKKSAEDKAEQVVFGADEDKPLKELKKTLAEAMAEALGDAVNMQVTDDSVIINDITAAKL